MESDKLSVVRHRTLRLNVPQGEITIGVAAYQDPEELTLGKIIALPLTRGPNQDDVGGLYHHIGAGADD